MKTSVIPRIASLLIVSSIMMVSWGQDLTWDNNGPDNNWDADPGGTANWTGTSTTWTNGNSAIFGTSAETVTLTENITAANITFGATGYEISTNSGNLTLNSGIDANENATISGSGQVILGGNNTWDVDRTNKATGGIRTLTVSANVSGGHGLKKTNRGTLILSGTNTYTGTTTVERALLRLAGGNAIADSSAVVVGSINKGATLRLDDDETIGTLSGNNNGIVDLDGNTLTINQTSNATFTGNMEGVGGSLTKAGNGTLTLDGANTYTGTTTVSDGTLVINGSLTNEGGLTVDPDATFTGSGSIGGTTTISGIHAPGNSPGIEVFNNLNYDGATVEWELIGNTTSDPGINFDRIRVDGDLSFANSTTLELDFSTASSVDWSNSFWSTYNIREWQVFSVGGTISGFDQLGLSFVGSGGLASTNSDGFFDGSDQRFDSQFDANYPSYSNFSLFQNSSGVYLRYSALPEPTTFGLLGLLLSCITVLSRRRRRLDEA